MVSNSTELLKENPLKYPNLFLKYHFDYKQKSRYQKIGTAFHYLLFKILFVSKTNSPFT